MAVRHSAAMPRHMLDNAVYFAAAKAIHHRSAERSDAQWLTAQRAVSNDVIGTRLTHIESRQCINIYPDFAEHDDSRMRIAACGLDRARRGYIIHAVKAHRGRKRREERREY